MTNAILVTGGSGFIGRPLIARLQAENPTRHVVNIDLLPGPGVHVAADIRKPLRPEDFAPYTFSQCIHLAAVAKEPGYEEHEYYDSNTTGTRHVLNLCEALGIDDVVFTSTMMVFSPTDERRVETDRCDPNTHYGRSKFQAEEMLQAFVDDKPTRSVRNLRPAVVFGPNDVGNFTRLRKQIGLGAFFYVGRRTTVKSCVHVDDVVGYIEHSLKNAPAGMDTTHLAIPGEVTIQQIITAMQESFDLRRIQFPVVPHNVARAASQPFALLASAGLDTGIHPRRMDKLFESTNLDATKMAETPGFDFAHPTVEAAIASWAATEA